MAKLKSISPLSTEAVRGLPVKVLERAIAYYESVMNFTTVRRDAGAAVLKRDGAEIRLVFNSDHRPEEADSVGFEVDDLDELHRELAERGGKPGEFDVEDWGGKKFRTFFMREHENGYCFCFYCPV